MESISDLISSAAITTTVAGNIGVDPFLTMFLVGMMDKLGSGNFDQLVPDDLKDYISHDGALSFWGIMSILEIIGKCIPVVDEMIDSVEVFIVPVLSVLGTLSTFGLYTTTMESSPDNRDIRELEEEDSNVAESAVRVAQGFMVAIGAVLALSIHLIKMLIRLVGEGWLTQILTVVEVVFCSTTITIAVYVKEFAIFIAVIFLIAMVYSVRKRYKKYKEDKESNDLSNEKKWWQPWKKGKSKKKAESKTSDKKTSLLPTQIMRKG